MTFHWSIDSGPWPNNIRFHPDGRIGLYRDDKEITPTAASVETFYERTAKRKVLNRLSVPSLNLSSNLNDAVADFSSLVAIDTNTRDVGSRRISVAGIVTADIERDGNLCRLLLRRSSLEFRGIQEHEERYAWQILFRILGNDPSFRGQALIGVVVDAHVGSIELFNRREESVWPGCFVPSNARLLYATSDAGAEYFPNMMIRDCDTLATQLLNYLEKSGRSDQEDHLRRQDDGILIAHWTAD